MEVSTLVIITVVLVSPAVSFEHPCDTESSSQDTVWRRDPNDCASAYLCLFGRVVTYNCPEGYVVGASQMGCVEKGSKLDDCTVVEDGGIIDTRDAEEADNCKLGEKLADDKNCGKYLECVENADGMTEMVTKECEYPMLFDKQTMKCDTYHTVACDAKQIVPKNQCDYDANQCEHAHCVPCNIRFPTCSGLPDGMNSWVGREWSPYYVICEEERVIFQGQCSSEKVSKVFHPEDRACVVVDEKSVFG